MRTGKQTALVNNCSSPTVINTAGPIGLFLGFTKSDLSSTFTLSRCCYRATSHPLVSLQYFHFLPLTSPLIRCGMEVSCGRSFCLFCDSLFIFNQIVYNYKVIKTYKKGIKIVHIEDKNENCKSSSFLPQSMSLK